eukprot:TRINITY_DN4047_c1_g1_i4.p1 TRINITY_DN4047_c1_g1~~TRINITY_DN4047_c1_g1_i4.p1  ORF type:complete len:394 (-),score=34.46 TRINITY_DN4047_c1_g1_i4:284-1297(-)
MVHMMVEVGEGKETEGTEDEDEQDNSDTVGRMNRMKWRWMKRMKRRWMKRIKRMKRRKRRRREKRRKRRKRRKKRKRRKQRKRSKKMLADIPSDRQAKFKKNLATKSTADATTLILQMQKLRKTHGSMQERASFDICKSFYLKPLALQGVAGARMKEGLANEPDLLSQLPDFLQERGITVRAMRRCGLFVANGERKETGGSAGSLDALVSLKCPQYSRRFHLPRGAFVSIVELKSTTTTATTGQATKAADLATSHAKSIGPGFIFVDAEKADTPINTLLPVPGWRTELLQGCVVARSNYALLVRGGRRIIYVVLLYFSPRMLSAWTYVMNECISVFD